jgi:enterochelin esterase-like enzyme
VVSGQLRKHEQFRSRFLRNARDLIVYIPPGYSNESQRQYPVLYLQDGQNLFDGSTSFIPGQDWHVGQTADEGISSGAIEPLIIVGMYNTKARIREYTPRKTCTVGLNPVGPPRSAGLLASSFIFQGCDSRLVCRAGYE